MRPQDAAQRTTITKQIAVNESSISGITRLDLDKPQTLLLFDQQILNALRYDRQHLAHQSAVETRAERGLSLIAISSKCAAPR
jgi:hypothetical protein